MYKGFTGSLSRIVHKTLWRYCDKLKTYPDRVVEQFLHCESCTPGSEG